MKSRFVLAVLFLGLSAQSASSQLLSIAPLPRDTLSRSDFLKDGYSGSVALVAGRFNSREEAERSDDLRLLRSGICYPLVDFQRSGTGRLYFAVSQAATNTRYRNAFLAAQVIRFVPSSQIESDVAVSRNPGPWVTIQGRPRPSRASDSQFLGKTAEQFVDAHALGNGKFQPPLLDSFFKNTGDGRIQWHARLPRKISERQIDGYYSSLDPQLKPVWTGLIGEFKPSREARYKRFVRSYLISLDFGSASGRPVVFATDPLEAEYIVVRIQSAPGSNLSTNYTFAFGLTDRGCGFLNASSGGWFNWFGGG
jgi:hypothetical protein